MLIGKLVGKSTLVIISLDFKDSQKSITIIRNNGWYSYILKHLISLRELLYSYCVKWVCFLHFIILNFSSRPFVYFINYYLFLLAVKVRKGTEWEIELCSTVTYATQEISTISCQSTTRIVTLKILKSVRVFLSALSRQYDQV